MRHLIQGLASGLISMAGRADQRRVALTRVRGTEAWEAVASSRSASQTLITDCRVTPSLLASRSSESIIHVGKSTFTRLCSCKTRRALDKSREAVRSTSSSNFFSKSLAFIQCHLFSACATNGYQSNGQTSISDDGRPVFSIYKSNHKISRFVCDFCRNLKQHRIIPKLLGFNKVDVVLGAIGVAFDCVKLKNIYV